MRIERADDKFAALFKAGKPRKKRGKAPTTVHSPEHFDHSFDDTIPLGTRLYKDQRDRQLDAIQEEDRRAKRAKELQQRRLDRLASQVPSARRFLATLAKVEASAECAAIGYDDTDADLAGLARSLHLAKIEDGYDRLTLYFSAMAMVRRVAKKAGFTECDPADYFAPAETCLDELKREMRI